MLHPHLSPGYVGLQFHSLPHRSPLRTRTRSASRLVRLAAMRSRERHAINRTLRHASENSRTVVQSSAVRGLSKPRSGFLKPSSGNHGDRDSRATHSADLASSRRQRGIPSLIRLRIASWRSGFSPIFLSASLNLASIRVARSDAVGSSRSSRPCFSRRSSALHLKLHKSA